MAAAACLEVAPVASTLSRPLAYKKFLLNKYEQEEEALRNIEACNTMVPVIDHRQHILSKSREKSMTKIRVKVDKNYKVLGFPMQETGIQNYSIRNSGSDIKPKSLPSTSDCKRNSPSSTDARRNSASPSGAQRNSPSSSDARRNSPSTFDAQRNSPSSTDAQRNSPSDVQRNSTSTSDAQRHSPSTSDAQRTSTVFPHWKATGKRGRKSSSRSTSSIEKQKEPVFGDKELVETLVHLSDLSNRYSANSKKKDRSTRFPVTKKRKLQDIVCAKDGLKKARIEKETGADYRDEIMLDPVKKTYLEASHQQITTLSSETFNCVFCGKPFNCYQALGGHKSSCRSNPLKKDVVVKSAVHDSNGTSKIHRCKICSKEFLTGQALGGHQKSHKTEEVEPASGSSSVSPPPKEINESLHLVQPSTLSVREEQAEVPNKKIMILHPTGQVEPRIISKPLVPGNEISKESLSRVHYLTSSVQEAQDEVTNKKRKVMVFGVDLNENSPKDMDELTTLRLQCLEEPI